MHDSEFEKLVLEGIEQIPAEYRRRLKNVAIVIADEPSPEQCEQMALDEHHTLLGLYEGVPQTQRGSEYAFVLPDKITVFKKPTLELSRDPDVIKREVAETVWHEIGHHFGLEEHEVEERSQRRNRRE